MTRKSNKNKAHDLQNSDSTNLALCMIREKWPISEVEIWIEAKMEPIPMVVRRIVGLVRSR